MKLVIVAYLITNIFVQNKTLDVSVKRVKKDPLDIKVNPESLSLFSSNRENYENDGDVEGAHGILNLIQNTMNTEEIKRSSTFLPSEKVVSFYNAPLGKVLD